MKPCPTKRPLIPVRKQALGYTIIRVLWRELLPHDFVHDVIDHEGGAFWRVFCRTRKQTGLYHESTSCTISQAQDTEPSWLGHLLLQEQKCPQNGTLHQAWDSHTSLSTCSWWRHFPSVGLHFNEQSQLNVHWGGDRWTHTHTLTKRTYLENKHGFRESSFCVPFR